MLPRAISLLRCKRIRAVIRQHLHFPLLSFLQELFSPVLWVPVGMGAFRVMATLHPWMEIHLVWIMTTVLFYDNTHVVAHTACGGRGLRKCCMTLFSALSFKFLFSKWVVLACGHILNWWIFPLYFPITVSFPKGVLFLIWDASQIQSEIAAVSPGRPAGHTWTHSAVPDSLFPPHFTWRD